MARYFFTLLLSLVALFSYSQQVVTFTVKNIDTKEVLPFCNVGIEGSGLGGITNEDGVITMKIPESYSAATISISHIGYEPQKNQDFRHRRRKKSGLLKGKCIYSAGSGNKFQ